MKVLSKIAVTLGLGLSCTLGLIVPSIAQTASSTNDSYQSNEQDAMYGNSTLGIDPIDLIHNYNLRVGRSAEEFNEESGTQIQNSAEEFRRLQQERMMEQYDTTPQTTEEIEVNY